MWYLIVSIRDLCTLTYFSFIFFSVKENTRHDFDDIDGDFKENMTRFVDPATYILSYSSAYHLCIQF